MFFIYLSRLFLGAFLLFTISAQAGSEGRGGIPDAIEVDAFNRYITGDGLKISVRRYMNTIKLEQMKAEDGDIKTTLSGMLQNGFIFKDIDSPGSYVSGLNNCRDANDTINPDKVAFSVRAWTHTGKNGKSNIGGKICFDIENLVSDYKAQGKSLVDAAISLTALALHEHAHHFQQESSVASVIEKQEKEANGVGGYVLRYAKLGHEPVVEWLLTSTTTNTNLKVVTFYDPQFQDRSSFTPIQIVSSLILYDPYASRQHLENLCKNAGGIAPSVTDWAKFAANYGAKVLYQWDIDKDYRGQVPQHYLEVDVPYEWPNKFWINSDNMKLPAEFYPDGNSSCSSDPAHHVDFLTDSFIPNANNLYTFSPCAPVYENNGSRRCFGPQQISLFLSYVSRISVACLMP